MGGGWSFPSSGDLGIAGTRSESEMICAAHAQVTALDARCRIRVFRSFRPKVNRTIHQVGGRDFH